jgi:hypothetical protein
MNRAEIMLCDWTAEVHVRRGCFVRKCGSLLVASRRNVTVSDRADFGAYHALSKGRGLHRPFVETCHLRFETRCEASHSLEWAIMSLPRL